MILFANKNKRPENESTNRQLPAVHIFWWNLMLDLKIVLAMDFAFSRGVLLPEFVFHT